MRRIPLTLRALVLVPLLAVLVDQARATLACGPQAQTCLEAAGRGWLGSAGSALLLLYAVGLALARRRGSPAGDPAAEPAPAAAAVAARQRSASPRCAAARRLLAGASATAPRSAAAGSSCSPSASPPAA